jgi:phospholipid/cholesterol/gamma-HCH transport system substrate-binding protein
VEIGKVEGIRVAPDHRLIEVTMKIDLSGGLEKQIFAQLRSAGITGIVFIDLDLIQPEYVIDFQTVPFETDHPIIPSRRSDANRFINDANAIIRDIRAVDFKGISDQLKASTKAVEMFLAGDRTDRIMARLEAASANLDQSMAQIRKTVDDGALKGMVQDTAETLAEGRRLINSARQEIEAMKLGEQTAKAGNILESLDQKTKAIALQLEDTAENLRVTSEYLQGIAERLNKQPSELIFSRPAPPRKPME